MMYDGDEFEHRGYKMTVTFPQDEDMGAPWDEHDGHGVVSEWTTRDKQPYERVLNSDRHSRRFYDFKASVKIAIKDGWGVKGGQREGETDRQYAIRAVEKDFEYLKSWCNDEWHYCGVVVECQGEDESLWGIEDSATDYLEQTARELADELADRLDRKRAEAEAASRLEMGIAFGCTL